MHPYRCLGALFAQELLLDAGYKGAKIQLLDLPGIIEGAKDGKGRGKRVIGTARTCSLILMVWHLACPVAPTQHSPAYLSATFQAAAVHPSAVS